MVKKKRKPVPLLISSKVLSKLMAKFLRNLFFSVLVSCLCLMLGCIVTADKSARRKYVSLELLLFEKVPAVTLAH